MGSEVFHTLKKELSAAGLSTGIGDEGGFAPNLSSTRAALDFILKAIEKAGYKPGEDIYLALDCASTEYFKGGKYEMKGEGKSLSVEENVDFLAGLAPAVHAGVVRLWVIDPKGGMEFGAATALFDQGGQRRTRARCGAGGGGGLSHEAAE